MPPDELQTENEGAAATPAQCRAARALLRWTQEVLARHAGVSRRTINDFELHGRQIRVQTRRDIATAVRRAGVELIEGEGVRFVNGADKVAKATLLVMYLADRLANLGELCTVLA